MLAKGTGEARGHRRHAGAGNLRAHVEVHDSKTQVWRGLTTAHRCAAVEVYAVEGARFGKLIDTSTVEVDAAVRQIEEALSRVA